MLIQSVRTSSEFARGEKSTERLHVNTNDLTNTAQGAQGEVILPVHRPRNVTRDSSYRALSLDELRLILAIAAEEANLRGLHDILTIISNTGVCSGELRQLRWADISNQHCRFVACENSHRGHPRYVPFGPRTYQMLEARREREPETEYVFGTSPRAFLARCSRQLRKLSETIGVEHISLSVLQNTFIARWVQSGKSLDALCLISGVGLYHWRLNFHVISEHKLAIAVREQAQFEEEL